MNINKINVYTPVYSNKNNKRNTNPVAFKGLKTDVFKFMANVNYRTLEQNMFVSQVAAFLNMPKKEITPFTSKMKRHKMNLLYKLSEKFNKDNYYKTITNTETNKKLVFDIYNKINAPQNTHIRFLEFTDYSFEQLNKIFDITEKDPKKLSLAGNLLSTYPSKGSTSQLPFKTLEEFLTTPSSSKIAAEYDDFKPYIELNYENPQIVKNLESEIQNGYNKNIYIKKLNIKKLASNDELTSLLNQDALEQNYKQDGIELLKVLNKTYAGESITKYPDKNAISEIIMEMYNSTTPQNLKARTSVLNFIRMHFDLNKKLESAPLEAVNNIFKKIDADAEARKFVESTTGYNSLFDSVTQIDDALSNADLKKLNSRLDLVAYALNNRENLAEFSRKDFKTIDKQIKLAQIEEKKQQEKLFFSPNPIITDLHVLKMKIKRFIQKTVEKFN